MKRVVVLFLMFVIALLVIMTFTKPNELDHYVTVRVVAMKVASQKLAAVPVADAVADQLPEELRENLSDDMLDSLSDMAVDMGTNAAVSTFDNFMRQNFEIHDYKVVNVGMVKYHGMNVPITIGLFGKVKLLVDEAKIQSILQ